MKRIVLATVIGIAVGSPSGLGALYYWKSHHSISQEEIYQMCEARENGGVLCSEDVISGSPPVTKSNPDPFHKRNKIEGWFYRTFNPPKNQ